MLPGLNAEPHQASETGAWRRENLNWLKRNRGCGELIAGCVGIGCSAVLTRIARRSRYSAMIDEKKQGYESLGIVRAAGARSRTIRGSQREQAASHASR